MSRHASTTCVALLRGVNVGGKNKLPMRDLATIFEQAGCDAVETYIQSGNVLFKAEPDLAAAVPHAIEQAIAKRSGLVRPWSCEPLGSWSTWQTAIPF